LISTCVASGASLSLSRVVKVKRLTLAMLGNLGKFKIRREDLAC